MITENIDVKDLITDYIEKCLKIFISIKKRMSIEKHWQQVSRYEDTLTKNTLTCKLAAKFTPYCWKKVN